MEGLDGRGRVKDDGRCIVANAKEASGFVCWAEESAAKVLGVMEEDDLLFVVCCRRKPLDSLSAVIFLSAKDSKFIAPVKPGMLRSPDSFAAVIESITNPSKDGTKLNC